MDCYDHAVHLLECSFRLLLIQRFRRRMPRDAEHTDQEMMEALAATDKAFVSWAALPIDGRAKKSFPMPLNFCLNGRAHWPS
jgi:hypothetical protein